MHVNTYRLTSFTISISLNVNLSNQSTFSILPLWCFLLSCNPRKMFHRGQFVIISKENYMSYQWRKKKTFKLTVNITHVVHSLKCNTQRQGQGSGLIVLIIIYLIYRWFSPDIVAMLVHRTKKKKCLLRIWLNISHNFLLLNNFVHQHGCRFTWLKIIYFQI